MLRLLIYFMLIKAELDKVINMKNVCLYLNYIQLKQFLNWIYIFYDISDLLRPVRISINWKHGSFIINGLKCVERIFMSNFDMLEPYMSNLIKKKNQVIWLSILRVMLILVPRGHMNAFAYIAYHL